MKKIIIPIIAVLFFALSSESGAANIEVTEAGVGAGIDNHKPIGVAERFPSDVGRIWCYSKVVNGEGQEITHRWFYGDTLTAEIPLKINYAQFRTYSYKTILPERKGSWRVDINAKDGTLLKSVHFTVE